MNCHFVQNLLSAYLDNELVGARKVAVETHVEQCWRCRRELESLGAVKAKLSGTAQVAAPVGLETRLKTAVFEPRLRTAPWLLVGLAAGASMFAFWLAIRVADRPVPTQSVAATQPASKHMEVASDRAYLDSSDPISGGVQIVTVNYAGGR
ncbi:MAG: zf-HC2 domain-containing protein [Armatimonadetes bacterium]|nr:zf-HC2 domain-containing protein [Armatimonadota bacterium]